MADTESLKPEQIDTLFDILTHYETYNEIEEFKSPDTIKNYGPPFQDDKKPRTPILQTLLSKFVLTLPSLKNISPDFWKVRVQSIIGELSAAELSESYDKGLLGIRKTLATAISALIEYPAKAALGGYPKNEEAFKERSYDNTKPEDVIQAWHDFLQQLVYGDLFDKLYQKAAETDDLTKHGELTQAAHEYVIVNLASFMHYTIVLSPEGPSIIRMIENVHKMAPYAIMKQTLRVGNVATMISGMVKIVLAKVSAASITNWLGVTTGADEGMNLLQQIITTVLNWDKKELKKRVEKIEKDKDAPSKEVQEALKNWIEQGRDEHLETRNRSREQEMSIVFTILSLSSTSPEMSDQQHAKALEYLSLQLSIRDRREIIKVLCHHNPDHMTEGIRTMVSAYEPMIRQVHKAVDLSATVGDFQSFMDDMIKLSKTDSSKPDSKPASVEDFVALIHKHQSSSHRFLHQVAKNGKEVTQWFNDYCHDAASQFRTTDSTSSSSITSSLTKSFSSLPEPQQIAIKSEIDAYATYLHSLKTASQSRISAVIKNETAHKSSTKYGPGSYLAKWQALLDSTVITPDKPQGPLRSGGSKSVKAASSRDVDGKIPTEGAATAEGEREKIVEEGTARAPSTEETVKALGGRFRELLVEKAAGSK